MSRQARGTFKVDITPQPPQDGAADPGVGRMLIHKQFQGELSGESHGQMLAIGTPVDGSAGYVAMERVTGIVHAHEGSFALQHSGTLHRGAAHLSIAIVPDSGTGRLEGISGTLQITVEAGVHHYVLDYDLPDPS